MKTIKFYSLNNSKNYYECFISKKDAELELKTLKISAEFKNNFKDFEIREHFLNTNELKMISLSEEVDFECQVENIDF